MNKIIYWIKNKLLSDTERKLILLSVKILKEYNESRYFRRSIDKSDASDLIKQIIKEWK